MMDAHFSPDFDRSDVYDAPNIEPDCPACGESIDGITVTYEPDDPNFGADADGRRGIFVPGETTVSEAPDWCPNCGMPLRYDCDRDGNVRAYIDADRPGR